MSIIDNSLVKMIYDELIDNPEAKELGTFDREVPQFLALSLQYHYSNEDIRNILDVALRIKHEFPFTELGLANERSRSLFSLAISQCWLLDRLGRSIYHGNLSALAVLMGTTDTCINN